MFILRLIAVMLLIFAAISVGIECVGFVRTHHWTTITAGQLWLNLHASSLEGLHTFVLRHLIPDIWDPMMVWLLRRPAWAATGVPGLVLLWLDLGLTLTVPRGRGRARFRTNG